LKKNGVANTQVLTTLYQSGTLGKFTVVGYPINPGMGISTWCASLATMYDMYKIRKFVVRYETSCDVNTKANVIMWIDRDVYDTPPATYNEAAQMMGNMRTISWSDESFQPPLSIFVQADGQKKYCRVGPVAGDYNKFDSGTLYIGVEDTTTGTAQLGRVMLDYEFEFFSPKSTTNTTATVTGDATSIFMRNTNSGSPEADGAVAPIGQLAPDVDEIGMGAANAWDNFWAPAGNYLLRLLPKIASNASAGTTGTHFGSAFYIEDAEDGQTTSMLLDSLGSTQSSGTTGTSLSGGTPIESYWETDGSQWLRPAWSASGWGQSLSNSLIQAGTTLVLKKLSAGVLGSSQAERKSRMAANRIRYRENAKKWHATLAEMHRLRDEVKVPRPLLKPILMASSADTTPNSPVTEELCRDIQTSASGFSAQRDPTEEEIQAILKRYGPPKC
jgi:hypothetical protein